MKYNQDDNDTNFCVNTTPQISTLTFAKPCGYSARPKLNEIPNKDGRRSAFQVIVFLKLFAVDLMEITDQ